MKNRNRIEISGFKFGKKEAESEAEKIINDRKNKIAEAKKEWLESLKPLKAEEEKLLKKIKEYQDLQGDTSGDVKIANAIKDIEAEIKEFKFSIGKYADEAEAKRLIKVKRIRKLNIKAYQILPVKCIGKRGANWIFMSEKQ